jgi:hypothetical protein
MRKQIISLALVGGLGTGLGALAVPGIASAADTATGGATAGVADRVAHIKDALKGLVTNGTITQAQADKVASTLATQLPPPRFGRGPGGPGRLSPDVVAKALGITVDELRAGHDAGKTLAQIAAGKGISKADLISKLVAAAKTQLAADVKAGGITQAQADQISASLQGRITDMVDRVGGPHDGRGPHGDGDGDGDGPPPATSTTPSMTTPSASSSSSSA